MKKVHIGFGFHVNLYHSFREDTNDDKGFAGDIRVIRHIIDVLDKFNKNGIRAKGTWDFENAFSLEETLPVYAPDIIEKVRRRVQENGDEPIIMGYNNGSMSASTKKELRASINWAITNEKSSGLRDVFGAYEPIVRPQEIMFTPSQTATYRELGVTALCLYYSSIPFDGFRTLIPLLPEKHAFNPLTYRYKEDSIIIIPTYNHGDLIDYGSLGYLVKNLHKKQQTGEIDTDVFIFLNMDADSEFWYGYGYPFPLSGLPNLSGLEGVINEVAKLPYVEFDTPGNYLKTHQPLREITFTQDIADGNFDGYSSWGEKPFNRQIWTRIERARALNAKEGKKDEEFAKRVRLLSTTHFGLSTPHLNIKREQKALDLSEEMLACIDLNFSMDSSNWVGGESEGIRYCLPRSNTQISSGKQDLHEITIKNLAIQYNKKTYHAKAHGENHAEEIKSEQIETTINGFLITGEKQKMKIKLPNQIEEGSYELTTYTAQGIDGKFYSIKIKYPYTNEDAYVYNEIAALQRPQDDGWIEVRPFEIDAGPAQGVSIIKRNYEGDISSYSLDSFKEADPLNAEPDSFNHQVTNGIVGVQTTNGGFLLAVQKQIANSMAYCPMRIRNERLYLNPFGTYYGKQRHHATYGTGLGAQAAIHSAPQFYPLAPAYNGAEEELMIALFKFEKEPDQELWEKAINFSEGSITRDEVEKDFCKPRKAKETDQKIPRKKITSNIPILLQIKIMLNGARKA
ncbi:MAG: hypothetical protein LBD23_05960 [Oscillospiraceae bacterium]|nr:hypothetical protein [Oscillospiraceae bacterium]